MKKVDIFSLSISLIINLIILVLMSTLAPKEVAGKIKVGLVSLDNAAPASYEGFKDVAGDIPVTPPEKDAPEVKEEKKPQVEKTKELSLEEKLQEIEIAAPKLDTPSAKGIAVKKNKKSSQSEPIANNSAEAPIKTIGGVQGIPSGYKLGAADGDIDAKWNPSNRNPQYPQSAQLKGLNGTVRLRLTIDEYGNVLNVVFDKGSGVPEINLAIEQVARTWKINLTKKGKTVYGDVILEYNFKLTGN